MSFIRKIPGFRSGRVWKMGLASFFYIIIILAVVGAMMPSSGSTSESGQEAQPKATDTATAQTPLQPLSANLEVITPNELDFLNLMNQNNYNWTNTKIVINDVWMNNNKGDWEVGGYYSVGYEEFKDSKGTEMPYGIKVYKVKIITDQGSGTYAPSK